MRRTAPDHEKILALAESRKTDNTIVLAFANYAYLEVLLNWLVAMNRLGIRNYLIVSLDSRLHEFLSERRFATTLSSLQGDLNALWVKRMEIFHSLAAAGIDFIHSDIDAVWLKNPIPDYFDHDVHDVIASQGTIWPPDVLAKHGFVFCCGLFSMRACREVQDLLGEMTDDVRTTGDDQITFNRIVASLGVQWRVDREQMYGCDYSGYRFFCSRTLIEGETSKRKLRLALLPHHLFQRLPMSDADAYVKHLLTPKTAASKIEMLEATGCLFLKPDWGQIEFGDGSIDKIDRGS